jgi:hypothetical protein
VDNNSLPITERSRFNPPIQTQHVVKIVPTSTNFNNELASSPAFRLNEKKLFQRHKKPHTQSQSLEQITTTLQREQLLNLILNDDTMNNNNELKEVYALPIKQRNPYPRGSPKHTRRANINRNVRAHLRHDLKRCKEESTALQRIQSRHAYENDIHRQFYSVLNNFHFWNVDRRHIEFDQVLIVRWITLYNSAKSIILDATKAKLDTVTINQMANLLWTKALHTKKIAANGTLSYIPHRWGSPMNWERLQHFRAYLNELIKEPINTPKYIFPTLNREFITQYEIDEEDQIAIGNMAPPPIRNTWQHSR